MKKSLMLAAMLLICGKAHGGTLDIRGWLDRQGTKLLAVEMPAHRGHGALAAGCGPA